MYNAENSVVISVLAIKAGEGVEIRLIVLLTLTLDGVRGQLHAPAAFSLVKVFPIQIE
jgi:hypothetical protein